jgi:DNA invertase Pin-like site-specific DNA recombinase
MGGEWLDTRNPTSKLMLTILAGVATWEREIMLERQREGIAKAKAEAGHVALVTMRTKQTCTNFAKPLAHPPGHSLRPSL